MEQPIASVSKSDILRIISRDFSLQNEELILSLLNEYHSSNEAAEYRVWASILKLSNGDTDKLKENIKIAIQDYRDVIAMAEYPEYSDKVGFDSNKIHPSELKRIINDDWEQYKKWFYAIEK